jgi:hypothetical protein
MPKFKNESAEANWWASRAGRDYVKRKSDEARDKGQKVRGSRLVDTLTKKSSVQIAIRLPVADLEQARKIASRKGYRLPNSAQDARPRGPATRNEAPVTSF